MTLILTLKDKTAVETFIHYMSELYDYIEIPKENLPTAIGICDNTITIFSTDEFFEYSYQFFIEQLLMCTSGSNEQQKRYLTTLSDYFRKGSDILLMNPVEVCN